MLKRNKPAVRAGDRAPTLSNTIISLPHPPPAFCRCIVLAAPSMPYCLTIPPTLAKSFIVVSGNAPSISSFFPLSSGLSQDKIVTRTIKKIQLQREPSNVFCSGYDKQLIRHHGSRIYDVNDSEVPKSTRTGTVIRKLESKGKQGFNCSTPRLGKRFRPFSWQQCSCKMQKQLTLEENSLNTHCNVLPTNTDCLRASFQPNTTSLSHHAKVSLPC